MEKTRTTKTGRKIIAEVKSFFGVAKQDIITGKLDKRGDNAKMFANVIPCKTIEKGDRICLRTGIKKYNGNYLIYAHGHGWMELKDLSELDGLFVLRDKEFYSLIYKDYTTLPAQEKIQVLKTCYPTMFNNLTKTETMLMAQLNGEDLLEIEKQISVDKSLKYKIRKHTENYAESFVKKIESSIA